MRTVKGRAEELERRMGPAKRIRLRVVMMRVDSPLSGDAETMGRIERALDEAGIVGLVDLCARPGRNQYFSVDDKPITKDETDPLSAASEKAEPF